MTAGWDQEVNEYSMGVIPAFGIPDAISVAQADRLRSVLEECWTVTYGEISALEQDFVRLRKFFDPVAAGHRLREDLGNLPSEIHMPHWIPSQLAIRIDSERILITPEGRCVISILSQDARTEGDTVFLPSSAVLVYEEKLLNLYRDWGRHRLRSVISLLQGDDKPLQLPAVGVLLVLLVNRSTTPDRAIRKNANVEARQQIDDAFFAAVYRFADAFGTSERRDKRKEGLVKGWTIGEIRRRFDRLLVSDKERLYLREKFQPETISRLGLELARRRDTNEESLAAGFDGLVEEMRSRIDIFASYGMAHERPRDTAGLRDALLDAYRNAAK